MDQRIIDLYDRFTHGAFSRRDFLDRLAALAGGAAAASALLPLLQNNYALAQTVPENDPRLTAGPMQLESVEGLAGYLAKPVGPGPFPTVLVIHENRGLNPHIRDVARRLARDGFLALALDYLSPMGSTPADEDKARDMIGQLKAEDALAYSRAAVASLSARPDGTGKVGAVGFCWGGGQVNELAVADTALDAGVAYYGRQAAAEKVPALRAALLLHYAGLDERINAGIEAYRTALQGSAKTFEIHMYPEANHAFNNDTNPARYDKPAADLAWSRTVTFLKRYLA